MVWLAAVVIVLGWAALMASTGRHADLFDAVPASARGAMRIAAWIAFASSLALFVAARGIEQGPVYWAVSLMLGAIATVLAATSVSRKTVRPR
jgi:hypothetical protein